MEKVSEKCKMFGETRETLTELTDGQIDLIFFRIFDLIAFCIKHNIWKFFETILARVCTEML